MEIFGNDKAFPKEEKVFFDWSDKKELDLCVLTLVKAIEKENIRLICCKMTVVFMENTETQVWLEFQLQMRIYIERGV